jgi:hypothetical protein
VGKYFNHIFHYQTVQQACQWRWEDGMSDMKWNKLFLENLKLKLEEDLVQQARN